MKYKGEYSPSYLADPVCHIYLPWVSWLSAPQEDFSWHPLSGCKDALERFRYACFTHPEHSLEGQPLSIGIGTCFVRQTLVCTPLSETFNEEPPPQIPTSTLSELRYILDLRGALPVSVQVTVCILRYIYKSVHLSSRCMVGVGILGGRDVARGNVVRGGTPGSRIVKGDIFRALALATYDTHCPHAQPKPSISSCRPVVPQCLQILEKRLRKAAFRAARAVGAVLAAHPDRLHASRMHDSCGDRQQHAGPHHHHCWLGHGPTLSFSFSLSLSLSSFTSPSLSLFR